LIVLFISGNDQGRTFLGSSSAILDIRLDELPELETPHVSLPAGLSSRTPIIFIVQPWIVGRTLINDRLDATPWRHATLKELTAAQFAVRAPGGHRTIEWPAPIRGA